MLNETNFKVYKEAVEIIFGCMDLDLTLWIEKLILTLENLEQGSFLKKFSNFFVKNGKARTSNLLTKLISIKYKDKGNIREYIMKMSNLTSKLKSLKLELGNTCLCTWF
ncbi:hypothetical protein CR513_44197, partial [Mucuna pruriens]